jgi:acetyl-CoA carboxylase carboxyl transferase subunit beta
VIEQITKQKLPAGFQTAEFLLEHGMIDLIVPRSDLRSTLVTLLDLYARSSRSAPNLAALPDHPEPDLAPIGVETGDG